MAFPSVPNLIKNPGELNPIPELGLIGGLKVDVLSSEELDVIYDISDRPVESGFDVTDARIKRPIGIRVEGILTDTQFTPSALAGRFIDDDDGFSIETWKEKKALLLQLADADELLDITLPMGFYPRMQIKTLKIEQREGRTGAAFFVLTAREVVIVSSEVVSIDSSQIPKDLKDKETANQKKAAKKGSKKKDGGNKSGADVDEAKEKSWALQLKEGIFGS